MLGVYGGKKYARQDASRACCGGEIHVCTCRKARCPMYPFISGNVSFGVCPSLLHSKGLAFIPSLHSPLTPSNSPTPPPLFIAGRSLIWALMLPILHPRITVIDRAASDQ